VSDWNWFDRFTGNTYQIVYPITNRIATINHADGGKLRMLVLDRDSLRSGNPIAAPESPWRNSEVAAVLARK
jgi:hypothetical protein